MMETKTYSTYEELTQEYLTRFRALRDAPPSESRGVARGAADIPAEILIERADEIAGVSVSMIPLAKIYLDSPDPTLREGISGHLLAQAAAELQVATELFEIAGSEATGPTELAGEGARPKSRAVRGDALRQAIASMEKVMEKPITAGLEAPVMAATWRGEGQHPRRGQAGLRASSHINRRRYLAAGGRSWRRSRFQPGI